MSDLFGKTALVTGGTRGIGRQICYELSKLGINIIVNYNSNKVLAEEISKDLEKNNIQSIALKANVSKADEVKKMLETAYTKFENIDILINNAGITKDSLLLRMKESDWDNVIDINLKGVYNCTKEVSRAMLKNKWGRIINISSVVGLIGNTGQANYAAAKAGIVGFTKSCAKEFAKKNVNVNAIAPGFIESDMTDKLNENIKNEIIKNIPLGYLGEPKDVAYIVSFLVSEKARYITGQTFNIDGGMVI